MAPGALQIFIARNTASTSDRRKLLSYANQFASNTPKAFLSIQRHATRFGVFIPDVYSKYYTGGGGVIYDSNAQALFNAITGGGDTLTTQEKSVTNDLFIGLKADGNFTGVWEAIYLGLGTTANSQKWNAVNPADTDAARRLTWTGSPIHSSNGITFDGFSNYGDTHIIGDNLGPSTNILLMHSRTAAASNTSIAQYYDLGCGSSAEGGYALYARRDNNGVNQAAYDAGSAFGGGRVSATVADGKGLYIGSVESGTIAFLMKNGTVISSSATSNRSKGPVSMLVGAHREYQDGNPSVTTNIYYSPREFSCFAFGKIGVTATRALQISDRFTTWVTGMGRWI